MRINFVKWCPVVIIQTVLEYYVLPMNINKSKDCFRLFTYDISPKKLFSDVKDIKMNGRLMVVIGNDKRIKLRYRERYSRNIIIKSQSISKLIRSDNIDVCSTGWDVNEFYAYNFKNGVFGPITSNTIAANNILWRHVFESPVISIALDKKRIVFLTKNGCVYKYGHQFQDMNLANIKQIGCCNDKIYLLHKDGFVFVHTSDKDKMETIKIENGIITHMSFGENHIGFLTKKGSIFMCGNGNYGQLGFGNFNNVHKMKKLKLNIMFIHVICGNNHTFIQSIHNNYYSFGNNFYSQCLYWNHLERIYKPKYLDLFNYQEISTKLSDIIITDIIPAWDETFLLGYQKD